MPFGHAHFLMLLPPDEPLAKEYSVGWIVKDRTDLWWCVNVVIVLPAAKSQSLPNHSLVQAEQYHFPSAAHRTVESIDAVMTCGSDSWHLTSDTVAVWPVKTCT